MASHPTEAWQLLPEIKDMVMQYVEHVPKYNGGRWTYSLMGKRNFEMAFGQRDPEQVQCVYWCFKCKSLCVKRVSDMLYTATVEEANCLCKGFLINFYETTCDRCSIKHGWKFIIQ